MTATYRYSTKALMADLARAGGGILVTAGPLPWLTESPIAFGIMATLAAAWGYLGETQPIGDWGADAIIEDPSELLNWLGLA